MVALPSPSMITITSPNGTLSLTSHHARSRSPRLLWLSSKAPSGPYTDQVTPTGSNCRSARGNGRLDHDGAGVQGWLARPVRELREFTGFLEHNHAERMKGAKSSSELLGIEKPCQYTDPVFSTIPKRRSNAP